MPFNPIQEAFIGNAYVPKYEGAFNGVFEPGAWRLRTKNAPTLQKQEANPPFLKITAPASLGAGFALQRCFQKHYDMISASRTGTGATFTSATTRYAALGGVLNPETAENVTQMYISKPGVFKNLRLFVSSNTLNGATTVNARKNGANTAVTLTITTGTTGWVADNTNSFDVTDGDLVNLQVVTAGTTGSIVITSAQIEFEEASLPLAAIRLPSNVGLEMQAIFRVSTTNFDHFVGIASLSNNLPSWSPTNANVLGFRMEGPTTLIKAWFSKEGTETLTSTGANYSANNWNTYKFVLPPSQSNVQFFFNDTLIYTENTLTNLPNTADLYLSAWAANTNAGVASDFDIREIKFRYLY